MPTRIAAVHVPAYIIICTHLSISVTLSSGVCGGVQKHNIHITAKKRQEKGYFLIKLLQILIFIYYSAAKLRCFSYICNHITYKNQNYFPPPAATIVNAAAVRAEIR